MTTIAAEPSTPAKAPVWANRDFRKLWVGQLVTQLGSEVTLLAVPLLAVAMGVSPFQRGVLVAIEHLPALLLGLPVGVLVDRHSPKQFMVAADFARALLLVLLAVLWNLDVLMVWGLCGLPGGLGFMAGAALAPRVARRIGVGRTSCVGVLATMGWAALAGVATGGIAEVVAQLMLATFMFGLGQALFNVSASSIMQTVTPREILGRVSSVASVLYRSTLPLGGLLGGISGEIIGMQLTVYLGALGLLASAGVLALRPVRMFRIPSG